MLEKMKNAWRIPELRKKIIYTFGMLLIYRLLCVIPVPGINVSAVASAVKDYSILDFMNMMTGGSFQNMSIMAMGITPYINSSIILQLLTVAIPALEKLANEGPEGRKKINEYTRYLTVVLAFIQAVGLVFAMRANSYGGVWYLVIGLSMAAGSALAMWIGERITENGIGNGISLLIMAGIVSNMFNWGRQATVGMVAGTVHPIAVIVIVLALLAMKKPQSRKFGFYVCLTVDIFLICTLRHNGVVPGLAVAVLCIVLTLKNHDALKWRPAVSALTAVVLLAVYKGPVFTALGVAPNGMSPYTTMMCAAGSCINKELPLSEESEQILEKALPLEDWGEYYSRFVGHDPYYWGRPAGSKPYKISDITARDAFTVYLEALRKYPDVVIKDRLDGTDILWDVVQPPDSFNARSFSFVSPFPENMLPLDTSRLDRLDDGSYIKTAVPAKAYYSAANTPINSAADMLLWRTGAYLITFWVLLLFWSKNRMGRLWWAALPMLANAAGSMLVLYHQSFRYVYFVQVSVLALLYITAAVKPHWNDEPQSRPANEIPDITPEKEDEHG